MGAVWALFLWAGAVCMGQPKTVIPGTGSGMVFWRESEGGVRSEALSQVPLSPTGSPL